MKRVLVLGVGGSAGINFVECLRMAEEKFYIVGTDVNRWHLELPNLDVRYLVPRCTDEHYLAKLNQLIQKERIEFVHAQPDTEVRTLSQSRDEIRAKTFLPRMSTIEACQDKMQLNEILSRNDVPVPHSIRIDSQDSLNWVINVLKERHEKVWLRALRGAGSRASLPVTKVEHAIFWIDYWATMKNVGYGEFMACEFLPGREYAFQSVWKNGELITSAARERLEYIFGELTPSGQTSSPAVAKVVHKQDVNETCFKAITAVDPDASGVFCVDLKENSDGVPCVTEINVGRFFTTSNFFAGLGANMPHSYVRLAYGEEIPSLPKFNAVPEGYYWIRLMDKGPILVKEGAWKSKEI